MTTLQPIKENNKTTHGKVFEKEFQRSFPDNMFIQRVKDDTKRFINVKNFCDFLVYNHPNIFLFELKSTNQKSLPFANISKHQIDNLYKYYKQPGVIAGFVINFRSHDYQTFFVSADIVYHSHYNPNSRRSFSFNWVKENGIHLPSTLLRTRYKFNLTPILFPLEPIGHGF